MIAARTGGADGAKLRQLIDTLPEGSMLVDFDPGQLIINDFSPEQAISELCRDVAQVRARDAARDLSRGRGVEVPLGQGAVDFEMILGKLEQISYRGYVTVDRQEASDPETDVGNAVAYLRQL